VRVSTNVLNVFWKRCLEDTQFVIVHSFNQELFVKRKEEKRTALSSWLLCFKDLRTIGFRV